MRYWGERATNVEMWQLEGLQSRAGSMSGAVETSVWGSWSPDSAPDTMTEQGMSNKPSNGSGTRSLIVLIIFLMRALANPPVLEGLDGYRWGRVGSFLCSSTGFTLDTGSNS